MDLLHGRGMTGRFIDLAHHMFALNPTLYFIYNSYRSSILYTALLPQLPTPQFLKNIPLE